MTPLISFFGWFDVIIATPFAIYLGYKGVKLELVKISEKDIPQEATPKMLLGIWNYVVE